ncbi:hypothetical protein ASPNIDRAFT_125535, partial [Aspergillus niger ATCC 1015]
RVFVHALNTVKRIPRTGTARPPASERLKLYGLYKQSMEAKRRYISTLIETMHNYASQTAEARELVAELEFEPGSPVASAAVSMRDHARLQPQSSNRLTRPEYEQLLANTARGRGSERLRVLSPVSQAESGFRRQMEEEPAEEEEEEEEEEVRPPPPPDDSKRWRRTVEQALTTMTAEIAAVREQLEARALAHRRRTGLWAWLKWLVWVAARQIMVDLALLGMLLIWMRLRGDRRLEEKLKVGWAEVKTRLVLLMVFRRTSS